MFRSRKNRIFAALGVALLIGLVCAVILWRNHRQRQWMVSVLPTIPETVTDQRIIEPIREADRLARADLSEKALEDLVSLYHANGFSGEAARVYDVLIQLQPEHPRWPYLLADILAGYGQSEEAISLLNRTLELRPGTIPARLRLGEVYQQSNRSDEAREQFEKVLELDADNLHARVGIARLEMDAGRWKAAITLLQEVTRLRPDFGAAWALLETAYVQTGDREAAAEARSRNAQSVSFYDIVDPWKFELLDYCYDPYRLRVAASTPRLNSTTEESVELLERAIALAPEDADIQRQLGLYLTRIGRFGDAEGHLKKAIDLEPDNPDAWAYLVNLYNEWRKPDLAEKTTIDGLLKCPDSPALNLEWGRQLVRKGQLRAALKAFRTMNRLRPEEASGYIEIARVYFRLNQIENGVEQLEKVLLVEPGNVVALTTLALFSIESGDEAKALEWMATAKAQPRVPKADIFKLEKKFTEKFGKPAP